MIVLDTIPNIGSCAQYAYWDLGEKEKAIDFMDKVIAYNRDDAGNYYDASCLHSRMGELEKAVEFFRTAFEKGYRRLAHI